MTELPIDLVLPEVLSGLRDTRRVVLRAEPGAGKTTRVPAAILDAGLAGDREVVVVEPRRIAARAAAAWVAKERGGRLGGEVGYAVRFERKGGDTTRLWHLTEGIFGRRLVTDPFLERVGVVVLDEFHERHLDGDLALAVVRHLQETVRPDLGLVVMSATLDEAALARVLPGAAIVQAVGRAHPVAIEHVESPAARTEVATQVAGVLGPVLDDDDGDVLVFLAGARDIRRSADAIAPLCDPRDVEVQMLHGMQPLTEQQRVLARGARRRVVLATNVAETALTVDGVTTVIDAGKARVARFDPARGVNRLDTVPISRAAAAQRAGRAGRTRPGRCVRLWSVGDDAGRRDHETPEIRRLDLTRMLLTIAAWGMATVDELVWLDPPPQASLTRATALLRDLGAIADDGLSDIGRRMLALPLEPRLARVALEADALEAGTDGALLAALASERDVLRRDLRHGGGSGADFPSGACDLALRMALLADAERAGGGAEACRRLGLDAGAVRNVLRVRRQIASRLGASGEASDAVVGRSLLAGFPDRVARRREPGSPRAVMIGGTGVALAPESVVREAELFVCIDVEEGSGAGRRESRVRQASAIERDWLALLPGGLAETRELVWDETRERAVDRWQLSYRDLVLDARTRAPADRVRAGALVGLQAASRPAEAAALGADGRALLDRLRFLAEAAGAPTRDPDALLAEAVAACASTCTSFDELRRADVGGVMRGLLTHAERDMLARDAPRTWSLPSGRDAMISYQPGRSPSVAAKIQEVFGLRETPRLGGGRVALVFELLAPNGRPAQVTDDLASFWHTTYADVRRQLRGRYPKHDWPEDPLIARPSSGPKRRRSSERPDQ